MNEISSKQRRLRTSESQKPVIGLAGGIGSGKSLVASKFRELGCAVIDADALAHQALAEPAVLQTLKAWWGSDILDKQGKLNRRELGKMVFANPQNLRQLEGLVHPRVQELREGLRRHYQGQPEVTAIVEDCPLLFEVGLDKQCDVVVFVSTDPAVRFARVKAARGWTREELAMREKNQLGLDIKASRADHILDNSKDEVQTSSQVHQLFYKIIKDFKHQPESAPDRGASA